MTNESESNRGRYFAGSLLPWLVAGGMLLVYLLTLNHSPNSNNIFRISELAGWYSARRFFAPLTFLLTYPLHWLPASSVQFGLNFFTAACAALSLGLLVRSVGLLPHDRTYDQRQREVSEFSLLTIPAAWLPPLFAALMCGLEMTFWENSSGTASYNRNLQVFATDAAGETVDLLLFAYCIRCLLEYRVSLRESWMVRFALAYGLGIANNWLMIGLFPGFLVALIWIRGLSFFQLRFLGLLVLCGIAGISLVFLFPIITSLAHIPHFGFWQAMHYIVQTDKGTLGSLPREIILLLSLTSILPIFIIGIRWATSFGDNSQIGVVLTTTIFHIVHALFLLACVWVAFDPQFSPREKGSGLTFLPLYYLGALSVGYFSGYFLLIFGTRPAKSRHRAHPAMRTLSVVVTGFIWILAFAAPALLVWRNLPLLRMHQSADAALDRFNSQAAEHLPKQGAIVLADDQLRLLLVQSCANRLPNKPNHLFINTGSLDHDPNYFTSLVKHYPRYNLAGTLTNTPGTLEVLRFMEKLAQSHEVYYVHPSFGYYFERFYLEPHGPVYRLKHFATNQWKMPLPTAEQIAENQKFWTAVGSDDLPIMERLLEPKPKANSFMQWFMDHVHLNPEPIQSAQILCSYYGRSLDYWGVELEKSGKLPEATKAFELALAFQPDNISAKINSDFNRTLISGKKIVIEKPKVIQDEFGKHRGWTDLLGEDGPFDDPSFCYELGVTLMAGGNYLQAINQFDRVRTLAPDYMVSYLWLCKLFLLFQNGPDALVAADRVLEKYPKEASALLYKGGALIQMSEYEKALVPLNQLIAIQTNNYSAILNRGIANLQLSNYVAAKTDYETLEKVSPTTFQVDYGLQEIGYAQKDTNAVIKYAELYLTNYLGSFPSNIPPVITDEVKKVQSRLKEFKPGAP